MQNREWMSNTVGALMVEANGEVRAQSNESHEFYMRLALEQARLAELKGEVPVGAVLVKDGEIIAAAHNHTIGLSDPSAHAEMLCIRNAGQHLGNYRMPGSTLYITLEPCCMCSGAIHQARVSEVVYAAKEPKTGADGSRFDVLQHPNQMHTLNVTGGVLADVSSQMLQAFFKARR